MTKRLLLAALVLFAPFFAYADGGCVNDIAVKVNSSGLLKPVAHASVRVCTVPSCAVLATISSEAALTPTIPNPITADKNGNYSFCAPAGTYTVKITDPGDGSTYTQPHVSVGGPPGPPGPNGGISVDAENTFTAKQTFGSGSTVHTPLGTFNGAEVGSVTYTAGKFGNALVGATTSNYINTPGSLHSEVFAGATASFTVEMWIKTTIATGISVMFGPQTALDGFWIGMSAGGKLMTGAYIGTDNLAHTATTGTMNDGVWHHVACVLDAGLTDTCYLDGTQVVTFGTGAYHPQPSGTIQSIGRMQTYSFAGDIDEVAVFNYAKYTASFAPPTTAYVGSESGLVALYHLDSNANDSVGPDVTTVTGTIIDPVLGITDVHIAPRLSAMFSNGGSVLTASSACTVAPSSGTLKSLTIMSNGTSGDATVNLSSETWAQFLAGTAPTSITNSHPLVLSSARGATETAFIGWTSTTITAGKVYCFELTSPSGVTGLSAYAAY